MWEQTSHVLALRPSDWYYQQESHRDINFESDGNMGSIKNSLLVWRVLEIHYHRVIQDISINFTCGRMRLNRSCRSHLSQMQIRFAMLTGFVTHTARVKQVDADISILVDPKVTIKVAPHCRSETQPTIPDHSLLPFIKHIHPNCRPRNIFVSSILPPIPACALIGAKRPMSDPNVVAAEIIYVGYDPVKRLSFPEAHVDCPMKRACDMVCIRSVSSEHGISYCMVRLRKYLHSAICIWVYHHDQRRKCCDVVTKVVRLNVAFRRQPISRPFCTWFAAVARRASASSFELNDYMSLKYFLSN